MHFLSAGSRASDELPEQASSRPVAAPPDGQQAPEPSQRWIAATFRGRADAPSAARRALRGLEHELEPSLFFDLSLCVSELVTDSVEHGRADEDSTLTVEVMVTDTCIRGEIRDVGNPSKDARSAVLGELVTGLYLVDRLADRWGMEPSADSAVWFEIDIQGDARLRPRPQ
jgi:anti-sigma regulatory factor (Ser/Thr protein kinase)